MISSLLAGNFALSSGQYSLKRFNQNLSGTNDSNCRKRWDMIQFLKRAKLSFF